MEVRSDRELQPSPPPRLRLVLQDVLTEPYLEDLLIECVSLPTPATGRVGLVHGGAADAFVGVTAWR